ncbi:MAG: MFS transporter [SAR202 cluster bacterium]|nr:MFS transporter [SAR202 cluster bacterium]
MRTPTFWLLVASFSLANLAFQGINISLAPYAQDLGHGDAVAAGVLSLRALLVFLAAPVWGLMSERASSRMVRLAPMAAQAGSCVCFLLAARVEFLWLGVVVYPLGFAGTGLMQEVLWANDFGPTHAWSGALHGDPASRGVQRSGAHCDEPHL